MAWRGVQHADPHGEAETRRFLRDVEVRLLFRAHLLDWADGSRTAARAGRPARAVRFDPRRAAILLIGGDKSPDDPKSANWNRWYEQYVPIADDLYDVHLVSHPTRKVTASVTDSRRVE
jgi:hypothetical protein